jgi:mono/diheme cytochrome c family protein
MEVNRIRGRQRPTVREDRAPKGKGGLSMGIDPVASRRIFLGLVVLCAGGAAAMTLLRAPASPPPAAIAGEPLLVQGRTVYLARCASCHGESGRGDGPISRGLAGPPVGDLTDTEWKHGDRPEQVLDVIAQGVPDTVMPPWKTSLSSSDLRGAAAYVYYLAGRPVPEALRTPMSPPARTP